VVDDADGDVNLGVDHSLGGEMLHHAPGSQFVVFRPDQLRCDGFKGFQEAGEVIELVKCYGLGERERAGVVPGAEFNKRRGQDCSFEVQVQLGLGQTADEVFYASHSFKFTGQAWVRKELLSLVPKSERPGAPRQSSI
jgi:hypothetical protein